MMRREKGFTLIELMIVIAIIAIIAAIAIPGLLQAQRASNERNASASLKTLASAEADFRANDRDGNKVNDFWTRDVCGLYGVCPVGSTEMIKLIEISIAGADIAPGVPGNTAPAAATETGLLYYTQNTPKAGYWYRAMLNDEDGTAYALTTNGLTWVDAYFNHSKFGFTCYPQTRSAGRTVYILNEGNTIFKRSVNQTYGTINAGTTTFTDAWLVGSAALLDYPVDTELKSDYAKMD